MALPNSRISVGMVRDALGAYSTFDVGKLCTHGSINKWSRWKPVHVENYYGPLTLEKLKAANFGISILEYSSAESLHNFYSSTSLTNHTGINYDINRPRGVAYGDNSPYRLGDFANYDKTAFSLIGTNVKDEIRDLKREFYNGNFYQEFKIWNQPKDEMSLFLEDIYPENLYYGVALSHRFDFEWFTGYTPGHDVTINWGAEPLKYMIGEVKVTQFLTNVRKYQEIDTDFVDDPANHRFYMLPYSTDNRSHYLLNVYDAPEILNKPKVIAKVTSTGQYSVKLSTLGEKYGTIYVPSIGGPSLEFHSHYSRNEDNKIFEIKFGSMGAHTIENGISVFPTSGNPVYNAYNGTTTGITWSSYPTIYFRFWYNGVIASEGTFTLGSDNLIYDIP